MQECRKNESREERGMEGERTRGSGERVGGMEEGRKQGRNGGEREGRSKE